MIFFGIQPRNGLTTQFRIASALTIVSLKIYPIVVSKVFKRKLRRSQFGAHKSRNTEKTNTHVISAERSALVGVSTV